MAHALILQQFLDNSLIKVGVHTPCSPLKSLWKFHEITGNNIHQVQIGDAVLMCDDAPWIKWQLAVIEDTI